MICDIYRGLKHLMRCQWESLRTEFRVRRCRRNYPIALDRVRGKVCRGEKLNVLFVVTEVTKWKTQSLYDAMEKSGRYKPMICVSKPDAGRCASGDEGRVVEEGCAYFKDKGMHVEVVYDSATGLGKSLRPFDPDIVFYQQSWFAVKGQLPSDIANRALTCYIPYFVPNYGDLDLDCRQPLHRMLYLHIVLNESWGELFRREMRHKLYAGTIVGLGHTMLDGITFDEGCGDDKNCVIYAPHWTINPQHKPGNLSYSTFLWNGRQILEYAKSHREISWIFKPHPNLRSILTRFGVMTEREVDAYYSAWEKIGRVELSAGYERAFAESSAMITDCGSFLTEYAATGKPIIHLISRENTHKPFASSADLFATYYRVEDLGDMHAVFRKVLERREDVMRQNRLAALRKCNLIGCNAAKNVIDYLLKDLER